MKEIVEKISSYHILNYLLPGVVFVILAKKFVGYDLLTNNIVLGLFLYYFIGLSISRIGSLFVDPVLKKISFIRQASYNDFIAASKKDPKIDDLSETNNMYRSLSAAFFLLLILKGWWLAEHNIQWVEIYNFWILVSALFILFLFSYKKQTQFIVKRISAILNKRDK